MLSKRERGRLIFFFLAMIVLPILAIFIRLFSLQLLQEGRLKKLAEGLVVKEKILEETRGTIYDRVGRVLAVSIEVDSLYADPKMITSKEFAARRLSTILNINKRELLTKLNSPRRFVWLKRKMSPEERKQIEALKIEGLGFVKEYQRIYPKGTLAGHLLGFVGLDNRGLEGVEARFDKYLRGQIRRFKVVRDAHGNIVRVLTGAEAAPTFKGCDLILTIDEVIQYTAEIELERVVGEYGAKGGSIVVMDPRSGEVLALAISPAFDPNRRGSYKSSDWRNRAITDAFEPGSTFKAITFAAALEEKTIDPSERLFCNGFIGVAGRKIRCHKEHGSLTLGRALEESCNVGTIEAALRLDSKKFYEYLRAFGFGNITGIDLPGEAKGHLRKPSSWSGLSQATLAIGQEVLVTPIQLAVAISALANDGYLMEPMIVKQIRSQDGRIIKEFKPTCIRQVIPSETVKRLNNLLEGVVLRGTGQAAQLTKYDVYGKTGTAQKFDQTLGKYSPDKFVSSFVGWARAGKREVLILVVIDEPKGVHWGSVVAAPAFKQVAQKILPYMGIFPEESTFLVQNWNLPPKASNLQTHPDSPLVMPHILGMSMRDAYRALSSYELKVVFEGSGLAVSQSPLPGTELKPGMVSRVRFEGG